jgi:hypothetical protein
MTPRSLVLLSLSACLLLFGWCERRQVFACLFSDWCPPKEHLLGWWYEKKTLSCYPYYLSYETDFLPEGFCHKRPRRLSPDDVVKIAEFAHFPQERSGSWGVRYAHLARAADDNPFADECVWEVSTLMPPGVRPTYFAAYLYIEDNTKRFWYPHWCRDPLKNDSCGSLIFFGVSSFAANPRPFKINKMTRPVSNADNVEGSGTGTGAPSILKIVMPPVPPGGTGNMFAGMSIPPDIAL